MATKNETTVNELKINYLSESDYNTALSNGEVNENEIYMTPISNSDITVSSSGSGNAVTSITASGNTLTVTKGSTFLTTHPSVTKSTDSTSTASPSHGKTFTVIDSVTRDTYGHVTKVNTKTITLPSSDTSTDTKVNQTSSTTNSNYPLLASSSTSPTSGFASTAIYNTGITINPSTKTINATTFNGALSGNASTSTKATQDSAGQQINKTYIKGLSVSGRTITYTKGDGTTGTITTQDNNTTYSAATTSTNGLLSYSSNVATTSEIKTYLGY